MKDRVQAWLASDGFKTFCVLKHGPVGDVLTMLQDGRISRSKAAESIAELLHNMETRLPEPAPPAFAHAEIPADRLRGCEQLLRKLEGALWKIRELACTAGADYGDAQIRRIADEALRACPQPTSTEKADSK